MVKCSACGAEVMTGAEKCKGCGLQLAAYAVAVSAPKTEKKPLLPAWFYVLCGICVLFIAAGMVADHSNRDAAYAQAAVLAELQDGRIADQAAFISRCGHPAHVSKIDEDLTFSYPNAGVMVTFLRRPSKNSRPPSKYTIGFFQLGTTHPMEPAAAISALECKEAQ